MGILCHYHGIKLTVEFVCVQIFENISKYAFSIRFSALKFDCFSLNSKFNLKNGVLYNSEKKINK